MVTRRLHGHGLLLVLGAFLSGACLSSPANDYLYTCANGQSCPTGTSCASDNLCHPVYVAGAGPADAGAYLCATSSPECPDGQTCGSNGLCSAGDGGSTPDGGSSGCDLATAFSGPNAYACGGYCWGLAVADFNHDGYNDVALAFADPSSQKSGVVLLPNAKDGTLGSPITSLTLYPCDGDVTNAGDFSAPDALAVGDFNGDGWPDLGLSISEASTLAVALNGQDGGFVMGAPQPATSPGCIEGTPYSSIAAYQPQGASWYLASVGYGVTDQNGDSTVAFSQVQSNSLGLDPWTTLTPVSGFIPFGLAVDILGTASEPSLALAESDGNGSDEVEVYSSSNQGSGPGFASTPSSVLASQGGTTAVSIADLNGDGLNDVVAVNFADNTISVFYATSGGFKPGVSFSTVFGDAGGEPVGAAIGDFDGDGRADIATVNDLGSVTILRGMPDGGFLAVGAVTSNLTTPAWIAAADLEDQNARDGGLPDLVISGLTGSGASSVEIFQNGCRQ